jgi:signal transduction histidine kinase
VDQDDLELARIRGEGTIADLVALGAVTLDEPLGFRLIGDVKSIPAEAVARIGSVVKVAFDFDKEMEELSEHALERYRELSLIYDFSEKASSATALEEVMDVALRKAVAVVQASGASIVTLEPDAGGPSVLASVGIVPVIGTRSINSIIETGRPLAGLLPDALRPVEGDDWSSTLACLPLRTAGRSVGVLTVMAGPGRQLRSEDHRLLSALASLAATRIEQARLTEANVRRRELAAIGQVASAIVHDFKNPLTAMRGFAEMIQMDSIPADEHPALAEQIIDNADRLWAMVEEILHFVRGNRASLDLQPISGADLTARLDKALRHGMPESVNLTVDLNAIGTIVLDERKFERVVVNLVRNASEAIVRTGNIRIHGHEVQGENTAEIIVEDDGPGIPRKVRDCLFDPFVTAGKSGGTGLGLAIVRKIVEEHGGTVSVESEVGQGARFLLRLPRRPEVRGN